MKAITINNEIQTFSKLPKIWNDVLNYDSVNNTDMQYADGWRDVVNPPLTEYQRQGDIYFDEVNDFYTYEIVDFTQEEIDAKDVKDAKDEFKNNLDGVYQYATAPDGAEWALKIGNDGKTVSVKIP